MRVMQIETGAEIRRHSPSMQTKETELWRERDDREILSWMMVARGCADDRCQEDRPCRHPSSDHECPVQHHRHRVKRTPTMEPGRLRIASTTQSCHSGL